MKTIAVIGSEGLLGSDLLRYLREKFDINGINRSNYESYIGKKFDIIVNANGNSRRYWANQHPLEDFSASTLSVMKSVSDFICDQYIYISSPDVYSSHSSIDITKEDGDVDIQKLSSYGFHKYLSELIVKRYKKNFLILRCSMMLGSNLKKGPFFDIMHSHPLMIKKDSELQIITTKAISEIIETLLKVGIVNDTINVGGAGVFFFRNIEKYFNKKIEISLNAEKQIYEMNIEKLKSLYPQLKTSDEYLEEYIRYEKKRL